MEEESAAAVSVRYLSSYLFFALLAAMGVSAYAGGERTILLNTGVVDTSLPSVSVGKTGVAKVTASEPSLWLVQFDGPVTPAAYARVLGNTRVLNYIPNNAYLIYAVQPPAVTAGVSVASASGDVDVCYASKFVPEWKFQPNAVPSRSAVESRNWAVQMALDDGPNTATLVVAGGDAVLRELWTTDGFCNMIVKISDATAQVLTQRPDVISVAYLGEPTLASERQAMVLAGNIMPDGTGLTGPGYLDKLAAWGFTQEQFDASDFVVDVADDGIDNGTVEPGHFALRRGGTNAGASRVAYNRIYGQTDNTDGRAGHGNIDAHIIAGYADYDGIHRDSDGYSYGMGICPFATIGGTSLWNALGTWVAGNMSTTNASNVLVVMNDSYRKKARISSNSWGYNGNPNYTVLSQTYDKVARDASTVDAGNQPMVLVVASHNNQSAGKLSNPATAKNVITVGASTSVHPFDDGNISDNGATSWNDIASFSNQGPCADGRVKPDVVAPGVHITGGVSQQAASDPTGLGNLLTAWVGNTVNLPTGSSYWFPKNQSWYVWSNGTSQATPAVSGACALMRQWFVNKGWDVPSPAMTKAFISTSTRRLTVADANLMTNKSGMGLLALDRAFDAGTTLYGRDQQNPDLFTAAGQAREFAVTVTDAAKPVEVSLAWTDALGSTAGAAYVNNLDLEIEDAAGNVYRGNVFSGDYTPVNSGSADLKNNCESVRLAPGMTGRLMMRVKAVTVAGDGVPGNGVALDQDFALMARNVQTYIAGDVSDGTPVQFALPNNNATLDLNLGNGASAVFDFTKVAAAGAVQVQMLSGSAFVPPAVFKNPSSLVPMALRLTDVNMGDAWGASLTWSAPAPPSGKTVDTVFRVMNGEIVERFTPVVCGNTVTVSGINAFSDWYVGASDAVPVGVSSMTLE